MKSMMGTEVDLSIIIVNYNGWSLLAQCLESIQRTVASLNYELWVVDNGSSDGSIAKLRKNFPDVKHIENQENLGFAKANNQAIPRCAGRHILLLNNDTIVQPDAMQTLIHALETCPRLAAVGPQLRNRDGSIQPSCMRVPSLWHSPLNYLLRQAGGSRKFIPEVDMHIADVAAVTGACLLLREKALAEVGLLDEGYFMYAEEADWCYRAHSLGWKIGYVKKAQVTHLGSQTAARESERFYAERRVARVRFHLKHSGHVTARLDSWLIRANIWLRWLLNPTQRGYYSAARQYFEKRVSALFRQFP